MTKDDNLYERALDYHVEPTRGKIEIAATMNLDGRRQFNLCILFNNNSIDNYKCLS